MFQYYFGKCHSPHDNLTFVGAEFFVHTHITKTTGLLNHQKDVFSKTNVEVDVFKETKNAGVAALERLRLKEIARAIQLDTKNPLPPLLLHPTEVDPKCLGWNPMALLLGYTSLCCESVYNQYIN